MCIVSNVGDWFTKTHPILPQTVGDSSTTFYYPDTGLRIEFDKLKAEVAELKELLIKAKVLDEKMGNPDCEMEAKIKLIKEFARLVGVSMDDVFKEGTDK